MRQAVAVVPIDDPIDEQRFEKQATEEQTPIAAKMSIFGAEKQGTSQKR
jgi:hypothetical protein